MATPTTTQTAWYAPLLILGGVVIGIGALLLALRGCFSDGGGDTPRPFPPRPIPGPIDPDPPGPGPRPGPGPGPRPDPQPEGVKVFRVISVSSLAIRAGVLRFTRLDLLGVEEPRGILNARRGREFVESLLRTAEYTVRCRDGWVYLPDGRMLNEEVIKAGWATTNHAQLKSFEDEARRNGVGVWRNPFGLDDEE